MTVRNLSPNTRYEFVVRLQLDQMSSPWSSVVYHQTPAAGKNSSSFNFVKLFQVYGTSINY